MCTDSTCKVSLVIFRGQLSGQNSLVGEFDERSLEFEDINESDLSQASFTRGDSQSPQDPSLNSTFTIDSPQRRSNSDSTQSQVVKSIAMHLVEVFETIIDMLCQKIQAMPYSLRVFFKALYRGICKRWPSLSKEKVYGMLGDFLFYQWLLVVLFCEPHLNGLTKQFNLGENCIHNLLFLGKVMHEGYVVDIYEGCQIRRH